MDNVKDKLSVKMNYTASGEHNPEVERNNRMIRERMRAMYHNLLYQAIPRTMIWHLGMVTVGQLNMFPAKG